MMTSDEPFRSGDRIECPYCENIERDSWEFDESSSEYQCGNCEKISTLSVNVSISYQTRKKCDLNGETHKFRDHAPSIQKCIKCGEIKFLNLLGNQS